MVERRPPPSARLASSGFRLAARRRWVAASPSPAKPRPDRRPRHRRQTSSSRCPGRLEVEIEAATTASDVVLISCSKTKLDHPAAARHLYDSPLFRQSRAYAVASGRPWFILSAEHGLVGPDEWLAPYERYLPDTPRSFRDAWGHWVVERLDLLVGGLAGRLVEIHAGAAYVEPIADRLRAKGCHVIVPLAGLAVGGAPAVVHRPRRGGTRACADPADPATRVPFQATDQPRQFRRAPSSMKPERCPLRPSSHAAQRGSGSRASTAGGLTSRRLRTCPAGSGHTVQPGMIYAGLAGATRWPSGKRSTNTLWSRIAGMHLGRRHEFSTFRRTLGPFKRTARTRQPLTSRR